MLAQYDVYGVGNALVDMEFEVTPDFLKEMKVQKGLMTLVDEARQAELINNLHGVQHKRSCGGSAANTLIAVAQMGGKGFYSCKVAGDETGDFYTKDLLASGLDSNIKDSAPDGITGRCMVMITPDADRTMNTYLGITETFSEAELNTEAIKNSKYLYMEGYLVTSPTGKAAAIKARDLAKSAGVKVALTFSDPGIVGFFKDGFTEMIGEGVDLIFCNEDEARSFTGKENLGEAFEALKKVAKSFAITTGAAGAILWDGNKEIQVVTAPVDAIDTNGAGDLFAGSFLYALTQGKTFGEAGKLACAASGKLVQQFGPRLKKEQAQEIKKRIFG
ncbi:MAG: adenosine kinase [Bdellovibrionales bacterium CG12_big_fil_rev_8_21_14_0_65_38_15]|nr:MAG: adenosine kinase [Bdellovibrionales bacterium CG22_combo_CG10-13_8_21_14_all_38_13]PIQ56982.1 MAG: adenosine kinase [Bdellovibrionales bacterium CG12_big_fil_rev_8_21_14_0_65_38_15]PIR29057.1 MAG: adenosine kinase [Bdellovibrionales bacterium CG11_big_fil_rev_8_21_14_0_20_38_13]